MRENVKDYILSQVEKHPNDIAIITANEFNVTRQTAVNYLTRLVNEGLVEASGKTRARQYKLKDFINESFRINVVPGLEEDVIWREKLVPFAKDLNPNVLAICQYGFTEMLRNVFDHSQSKSALCYIERNAICVSLGIIDHGVGIFNKIQKDFNLNDPRHALLELSKGKLTSDPKSHSGEGIFFTSRMFDTFGILSEPLFYSRVSKDDIDWLIEVGASNQKGTYIKMDISPYSKRTTKEVFDTYSPDKETYGFTKTHVPIQLAKYEGEQLVSRSQARRLLARIERFNEVILDFKGITMIGQSFADEIFRVYQQEHTEVSISAVNTTLDVNNMIKRAQTNMTIINIPSAQQKLL